jgi:hypothetical protein
MNVTRFVLFGAVLSFAWCGGCGKEPTERATERQPTTTGLHPSKPSPTNSAKPAPKGTAQSRPVEVAKPAPATPAREIQSVGSPLGVKALAKLAGRPVGISEGSPCETDIKVQVVSLKETPADDTWLVYLKTMPNIRSVNLCHTAVTNQGLASLAHLSKLEELYLDGTKITDAGLSHLYDLKKLYYLNVSETAVTRSGVAKLAAALPGLHEVALRGKVLRAKTAWPWDDVAVDLADPPSPLESPYDKMFWVVSPGEKMTAVLVERSRLISAAKKETSRKIIEARKAEKAAQAAGDKAAATAAMVRQSEAMGELAKVNERAAGEIDRELTADQKLQWQIYLLFSQFNQDTMLPERRAAVREMCEETARKIMILNPTDAVVREKLMNELRQRVQSLPKK